MPIKRTVFAVKKAESAHPNSRKASQLQRALLRNDKLASRLSTAASTKQHPLIDKLTWFQLQVGQPVFSAEQSGLFIEEYLGRFAEEIGRLRECCRAGRPVPPRLSLIEQLVKKEREEYAAGSFEMVDLGSEKSVRAFKAWTGDYNALATLKIIKYKMNKN